MKAPSLPTPAEIPCPVGAHADRVQLAGHHEGGHVRAELGEEVAHPVHQQERGHAWWSCPAPAAMIAKQSAIIANPASCSRRCPIRSSRAIAST